MSSHGVAHVAKNLDADKEEKLISEYRDLVDVVTSKIRAKVFDRSTLDLIASLLRKNPEYYTIWNYRRLVLQALVADAVDPFNGESSSDVRANKILSFISADLRFLLPLLKEFPKCYWIWNYRHWLLSLGERELPAASSVQLWQQELGLVGMMLTRDERNFHGWGYRRQVVERIERLMKILDADVTSLVEQEFEYTTQMIKRALQNFSALHYRSKLIPRLLDERNADGQARREMLEAELDLMQNALVDPFNQSAWFYHQFLMQAIANQSFVHDLSAEEIQTYHAQEIERIREILEDVDDCKWVYQALVGYTQDFQAGKRDAWQAESSSWLAELARLDPYRRGRWSEATNRIA